jgi:hypothetical protein
MSRVLFFVVPTVFASIGSVDVEIRHGTLAEFHAEFLAENDSN